jgi:peptidoglycan hydrolase-like protein with peptidoglycan-binding domain
MTPLAEPAQRHRRRRGPAVLVAGIGVVAVGAATAAAVGFGGGGEGTADASGLPPASATVDRETLRDVQTETGTLGYGSEQTLANRLAGTVTGLAATGATVGRGEVLYRLDDHPVVLMYGSVPAFRPLSPGIEGPDVAQLEKNLEKLGYTGFTVDDEYTYATADAVEAWQEDLGLPETGVVDLGPVVFAPGKLRVGSYEVVVGDVVAPGQAVYAWTGTERVVTVQLDVGDERLAEDGTPVTVRLPGGTEVAGEVTGVQTVIETAEGDAPGEEGEPETVLEVTVSVEDPAALADFDQASVEVAFTASEREDVLTVPVAALLALREGGYGVEVIEGASSRIVAVETGLFAGGRVEVTGEGLTEGMTVGMPS